MNLLHKKFAISAVIVLSVLIIALLVAFQGGKKAPAARVYLEPATLALDSVGEAGTVEVVLEGVSESAGFQFELSFDKSVIQIDSVTLPTPTVGDGTSIPLQNVRNEEGKAIFGVATLCEGKCSNTLTGLPVTLATLAISAVGEGETTLELNASDYILYGAEVGDNNLPVELKATLTGGRVSVGATSR